MSDSNSAVLQQAYMLVEAGQAEEARRLVESVLEAEQANPDAWWIYAHAVDDPVRARQALNEVLAINPDYPGVAQLIATLDEQYPDAAEAAFQGTPILLQLAWDGQGEAPVTESVWKPEPVAAEPKPEFASEEPTFVARVPKATVTMPVEERRGTPWLLIATAAAALILVLVIIALLTRPDALNFGAGDDTSIAGAPTLDATALASALTEEISTAEVLPLVDLTAEATETADSGRGATSEPVFPMPSLEVATLAVQVVTLTPAPPEQTEVVLIEPTALPTEDPSALPGEPTLDVLPFDDLNALQVALSAFSAPPESALTTEATPLGEALVASFCTEDGPQLRDLTRQVMDTVTAEAPQLSQSTGGVGVRAVDCASGQTLRLIVVNREAATLFAQGEISREGFESQWLSL